MKVIHLRPRDKDNKSIERRISDFAMSDMGIALLFGLAMSLSIILILNIGFNLTRGLIHAVN